MGSPSSREEGSVVGFPCSQEEGCRRSRRGGVVLVQTTPSVTLSRPAPPWQEGSVVSFPSSGGGVSAQPTCRSLT
jgi:hypothetical protein